jgi:hypothetical protein
MISRLFRIAIALITAGTVLLANSEVAFQQPTIQQPLTVTQLIPPQKKMMAMPLVAPLFIQDDTRDSEITMVSDSSKALNVEVIISGPSGEEIVKTKVVMDPYSQKKLKISDLLIGARSYRNVTYGSVVLMPDRQAPLAAQLSIGDTGPSPSDVEEEFLMMMGSSPASYRGVVDGLAAMPFIAIRSLSTTEQTVQIGCLLENGRLSNSSLAIKPNRTLFVQACRQGGSPSAQSAGFGAQAFKLQAAVANFSNATKKATILMSTGSGTESTQKPIATLMVPPDSVRHIDLPDVPGEPIPANSIVVRTDGGPGEVLSDLEAISATSAHPVSITLPWKDQNQRNNGGEHPWTVAQSVSSTVVLFNPDPDRSNESIQLSIHAGQTIWTKRISVPPLATVPISLSDIIQKQTPDDKGRMLPQNSSEGIVTWFSPTNPRIFGKLVQSNDADGVVRTYACGYESAICGIDVPNVSLVTGSTVSMTAQASFCDTDGFSCSCLDSCGTSGWGSLTDYTWSSFQPGIASITSTDGNYATIYGNAGGQATIQVGGLDSNYCRSYGSGSADVLGPQITSISPAQGLVGDDSIQVTINGSGFDGSSTITSDCSITATIQSVTSTQIVATLAIPDGDSGGNANIYVAAQTQRSNGIAFYRQVPSNSSVISARALPAGTRYGLDGCDPGQYGIQIDVLYQVLDQQGNTIKSSKMRPKEKDLSLVINGVFEGDQQPNWVDVMGGTSQITAGRTYTDANGQFEDAPYGLCSSSPFTATYTQPLTVTVKDGLTFYPIRTNHVTQTSSVPNQGNIYNDSNDINVSVP